MPKRSCFRMVAILTCGRVGTSNFLHFSVAIQLVEQRLKSTILENQKLMRAQRACRKDMPSLHSFSLLQNHRKHVTKCIHEQTKETATIAYRGSNRKIFWEWSNYSCGKGRTELSEGSQSNREIIRFIPCSKQRRNWTVAKKLQTKTSMLLQRLQGFQLSLWLRAAGTVATKDCDRECFKSKASSLSDLTVRIFWQV